MVDSMVYLHNFMDGREELIEGKRVSKARLLSLTQDSIEGVYFEREVLLLGHHFIPRPVDVGFLVNTKDEEWWTVSLVIQDSDTLSVFYLNKGVLMEHADSAELLFMSRNEQSGAEPKQDYDDLFLTAHWSRAQWNALIGQGMITMSIMIIIGKFTCIYKTSEILKLTAYATLRNISKLIFCCQY